MKKRRIMSLAVAGLLTFSTTAAFAASGQISASDVTITNNYVGTSDTISISNSAGSMLSGDVVKVYKDSNGSKGAALGSATATGTTTTVASITVAQLGQAAGNVWIALKTGTNAEGTAVKVAYGSEPVTTTPSSVVVTNYSIDKKDKIVVNGTVSGDKVTVYKDATGTTTWGTATATTTSTAVEVAQLGTGSGTVYVTIKNTDKMESSRVSQAFVAEAKTATLGTTQAAVVNNVEKASTISIVGLGVGDKVAAYSDSALKNKLGTEVTVAASSTTAAISVPDGKLTKTGGSLYVTLKSPGLLVSDPLTLTYGSAPVSSTPSAVTVVNNVDSSSTATLTGLAEKDILTAYSDAALKNKLGTFTVKASSTTAAISITSSKLDVAGGTIYVTLKTPNKMISTVSAITYSAKAQNAAVTTGAVSIANYSDVSPVIQITGLTAKDKVYVYETSTSTKTLATGIVKTGKTSISLNLKLADAGGTVYVCAKTNDKEVSTRTAITYTAKP
jgi:hypothetical protein